MEKEHINDKNSNYAYQYSISDNIGNKNSYQSIEYWLLSLGGGGGGDVKNKNYKLPSPQMTATCSPDFEQNFYNFGNLQYTRG